MDLESFIARQLLQAGLEKKESSSLVTNILELFGFTVPGENEQKKEALENIITSWSILPEDHEDNHRDDSFCFQKTFEFAEKGESCGFLTYVIQISKNNCYIESEANDPGHIKVSVFSKKESINIKGILKVLLEIESVYNNCNNNEN